MEISEAIGLLPEDLKLVFSRSGVKVTAAVCDAVGDELAADYFDISPSAGIGGPMTKLGRLVRDGKKAHDEAKREG